LPQTVVEAPLYLIRIPCGTTADELDELIVKRPLTLKTFHSAAAGRAMILWCGCTRIYPKSLS
jgi:hypothetical protein